jgi:hypothetical protein
MGPLRIAMWSGPRNLSTTMMRSFGARADTAVVDEPFYAAYLKLTGLEHPMTEDILAAHETDPGRVIAAMTGAVPQDRAVFYQKHMIHHMVDGISMDWLHRLSHHVMLVRHPARVIASYQQKMDSLSLDAIGVQKQFALWLDLAEMQRRVPPVVDADRILTDPRGVLTRLCDALGLDWDEAMLSWPPGPRPEDGVWAPHWYDGVWASTGFGAPPGKLPVLEGDAARIEKEALVFYERLLEGHV